jgi:hypothetical protein
VSGTRFAVRVSPRPSPFPPSSPRALPTRSTTSSVQCERPTPRRHAASRLPSLRLVAHRLPVPSCHLSKVDRNLRGLPASVQETFGGVPNSSTTEGTSSPRSRLWRGCLSSFELGLPRTWSGSTPSTYGVFVAASPGPSPRLSTLWPRDHSRCHKTRLPWGRALPGVGLADRSSRSSSHLLSPAGFGRRIPRGAKEF